MRNFLVPCLLILPVVSFSVQVLDVDVNSARKAFKRGVERFYLRQYSTAIQEFNRAVALYPYYTDARIWLGKAYLKAGFVKNAISEWEKVLASGGGDNLLRTKINDIYFRLGMDKAVNYIKSYAFLKFIKGEVQNKKPVFVRAACMDIDDEGRIWLSGFSTKSVVKMTPDGEVLLSIAVGGSPFGVAVDKSGNVWVSILDKDKVIKLDKKGKRIVEIGGFGYRKGRFAGPEGVAVDKYGYVYVVDSGNDRVQKFSPDGKFILEFGKQGNLEGEFFKPTDVAVWNQKIIVSDTGNRRIQVFDDNGNYLYSIDGMKFLEPRGLFVYKNKLFVVDAQQGIYIYDFGNESWKELGVDKRVVNYPVDVVVDPSGYIFESDFNSSVVAVFIPQQLRYVNLNVSVDQIWTAEYPKSVYVHLRVWDRLGRPVFGLTDKNFTLTEEGEKVFPLKSYLTYKFKNQTFIVLVVDKSREMEKYEAELETFLRTFLSKFSGKDEIEIVLASDEVLVDPRRPLTVLDSVNFIMNTPYASSNAVIGKALYKAVQDTFNINVRKAVIFITDGNLSSENFVPYDADVISTMARENAVRVYVVSFGRGTYYKRLKMIAEDTSASFIDLFSDRKSVDLYKLISKQKPLEYILSYMPNYVSGLRGKWLKVVVEVRSRGMWGKDETGYFVPEE